MVAYLDRQIVTAGRLGFRVVRIQIGASPAVIERCLPTAERYGIALGMEVHAPEGPRTDAIKRVIEFYDRVDSPLLGFIPDFSSTIACIDGTSSCTRNCVAGSFSGNLEYTSMP